MGWMRCCSPEEVNPEVKGPGTTLLSTVGCCYKVEHEDVTVASLRYQSKTSAAAESVVVSSRPSSSHPGDSDDPSGHVGDSRTATKEDGGSSNNEAHEDDIDSPIEFEVRVHKESKNSKLGLDTLARNSSVGGRALQVRRIRDGLISDWNSANPSERIRVGDHICEVNGQRSHTNAMYHAIATSSEIRLKVHRSWPPASSTLNS